MEHSKHLPGTIAGSVKPYPLIEEDEDVYSFVSDHGIGFGLWFSDGPLPQSLEDRYYDVAEFSFMPEKGKELEPDKRIGPTVAKALQDYLNDPKNVVVYICDEENGRGVFRQRLFRNWHKLMGEGFEIHQFQPMIITPAGKLGFYAGIIYRTDCPDKTEVVNELQAIAPSAIIKRYFT